MPPTKAKSASRSADADDGANAIGDDFTKKLIPRELELQITEGRARLMRDLERLNATTGKLDATRNNTVTFLRTVSNVKEQEIDSFLVKPNVGSIDTSAAKTLIAWLGCEIISIKSDSARVQIYVSKYDQRRVSANLTNAECIQLAIMAILGVVCAVFATYCLVNDAR